MIKIIMLSRIILQLYKFDNGMCSDLVGDKPDLVYLHASEAISNPNAKEVKLIINSLG